MEASRPVARAELPVDVTLLDAEPGQFAFCLWRKTMIVVWATPATVDAVSRLKSVSIALNSKQPYGVSSVHIVAADIAVPDTAVRAAFVDLMRNHTGPLGCLSIVLCGGGFWASAIRSVVLGMRMLAPRTFSMNFHTDTKSSGHWLAKEVRTCGGETFKPEDLIRAMDAVLGFATAPLSARQTPAVG